MRFRPSYAIIATILLLVEIAIATCIHDDFVRPHVGDSLAVLLVYCALRAFTSLSISSSLTAALMLAFAIEFGQLIGILTVLSLEHDKLARMLLGTGFDPRDFVAYSVGGITVGISEYTKRALG